MPVRTKLDRICDSVFVGFPQVGKSDAAEESARRQSENRGIGLKGLNPIGFVEDGLFELVRPRGSAIGAAKLRVGDLLVAVRGSLPKVAIVEAHAEGVFASSNLTVIRPCPTVVDSFFLLAWFHHRLSSPSFGAFRRASTGQLSITKKDLIGLEIQLPAIEQQQVIGNGFQALLELRRLQGEIARQYELVGAAYLQSAFQGGRGE